jgi:hypothetical protein
MHLERGHAGNAVKGQKCLKDITNLAVNALIYLALHLMFYIVHIPGVTKATGAMFGD